MDIEEIKRLKRQMEDTMSVQLAEFYNQTRVVVTDISLTRHEARSGMTGGTIATAYDVKTTVEV